MAEMSPLIPVDEAIQRLLDRATPVRDVAQVGLTDCVGRVLARDIVSAIDVPPADNSQMDGYALNVDDDGVEAGVALEVSDRIAAGYTGGPLEPGTLARIFTGAPIPPRANAVVMQENTEVLADGRVVVSMLPAAGENIRPAGQDIKAGTRILSQGRRLRPEDAALMASVGNDRVDVFRKLRIAIMSTGDELVTPPGPIGPGQIFNSNHYALLGLVAGLGMEPIDLGLVADTAEATETALARGAEAADCVISSGGVSVGEEDHVKRVLEQLGHLEMWRLAIKPGKPLAFGDIGGVPFFGLPGNPVSTYVTFNMIARPYLLKYQGASDVRPRRFRARATFEMAPGTRREYVRVQLGEDSAGHLTAAAYGNQGSGVMSSVSWADALAEVDIGQAVKPGDELTIYLLPGQG